MRVSTRAAIFAALLGGVLAVPTMAQTPAAGSAPAAQSAPAKAKTAQQERMTTCNAQAKGKKGDERKTFMSSCLKGEKSGEKPLSKSQQRMKDCNAEAGSKSLSGDQRKAFMSTCLKAK